MMFGGEGPHGDVGDGDTLTVNYEGKSERVRVTGIQAMEMTRYSSYPDRRRGECHSVAAANRLESLVKQARGRVRIGSQDPNARTGHRIRRSLAVWIDGRWQDAGRKLVAEGHALWLPNGGEYAWNDTLSTLSQQAGAAGRRIWDRDFCGAGPGAPAQVRMSLRYNAEGYDNENVNGEYAVLRNTGTRPLPIGGWYFRDSALRRYHFAGTRVAPGKSVTLHVGKANRTSTLFFWGYDKPLFENSGDGGYLFDPQGDLRAWVVYPCRFAC